MRAFRASVGATLLVVLLAAPAASQQAAPVRAHDFATPTVALATLQKAHAKDGSTFVVQDELDCLIAPDGGGACASAAGSDVLQTLRVMAGLEKHPNPHKVALASFVAKPGLLKGRVTNDLFVQLVKSYEPHLGSPTLDTTIDSAPNSKHATDGKRWTEDKGPDLAIRPGQIRVLSYTVTEAGGKVLGRHFVLLKDYADNQVTVLDPSRPTGDRTYILDRRKTTKDSPGGLFLLQPPGMPRKGNFVYELNTVFTVALVGDEDARFPRGQPGSVDRVKRKIDETVTGLEDTDRYTDPRTWRKKTAKFGLPGLDLPKDLGGSDWPATKMIDVFRHAGRHNLNFRDVVGGAHVRPLASSKDDDVRDVVRQVAEGKAYIAISITEPSAGSDVTAIKSKAKKVDGGFLLTGTKRFNARLGEATHVIIFTQGTTGEEGKLSAFLVPIPAKRLKVETFPAHGLTGNSFGGLSFKDLFVPESQLIGEDGKGMALFHKHFLYWRLMQAAAAIGTGEGALQKMADRIKNRHAFDGPIGRFTHLQQPIGQHTTELRMAYALAREAAELLDRNDYDAARPLVNGIKAEGVEIALKAADASMRAFGAEGYTNEVDIGDRVRDLMGLRIADGTTDVMRMDVVRQKFGEAFWEMAIQSKKR